MTKSNTATATATATASTVSQNNNVILKTSKLASKPVITNVHLAGVVKTMVANVIKLDKDQKEHQKRLYGALKTELVLVSKELNGCMPKEWYYVAKFKKSSPQYQLQQQVVAPLAKKLGQDYANVLWGKMKEFARELIEKTTLKQKQALDELSGKSKGKGNGATKEDKKQTKKQKVLSLILTALNLMHSSEGETFKESKAELTAIFKKIGGNILKIGARGK